MIGVLISKGKIYYLYQFKGIAMLKYLNIIFILLTVFLITNCITNTDSESFECSSDENSINLIFKYGVSSKNILNTYDCTYQKDLVFDPPAITNLKLTIEEIDSIYYIMQAIDFFNYPDTFHISTGDTIAIITPSSSYFYSVETDSLTKELYWEDSIILPDTLADKLRYLNNYIIDKIESKDEYKKLPEPNGGYD